MSLSHFAAGPHRALPARHDPAAGARNRGHVANPRGCFHFLGQEMAVCRHPSPPQPIPPLAARTPTHSIPQPGGRGGERPVAARLSAARPGPGPAPAPGPGPAPSPVLSPRRLRAPRCRGPEMAEQRQPRSAAAAAPPIGRGAGRAQAGGGGRGRRSPVTVATAASPRLASPAAGGGRKMAARPGPGTGGPVLRCCCSHARLWRACAPLRGQHAVWGLPSRCLLP